VRKVRRPSLAIHIPSSHTFYIRGACHRRSRSRCGPPYSLLSTGRSTPHSFQGLYYL
jgi:hypothetical protein